MQTRLTALLLILLAVASLPTLYGIVVYGVDIPFHDEWGSIWLLRKSFRGILTITDLLKPQNSYRQLAPNLLFIFLAYTTKLNLKWEMVLTFSMVAHTGWMWSGFLRRAGSIPFRAVAGLSFFLFSILFTLSQYENWVLGMQFVYFFPVYCLTLCIRVASSEIRLFHRSVIVILISFLCTLSSANGFLCWLSLLPLAWESRVTGRLRINRHLPAVFLSLAFLAVSAYLFDYEKPGSLMSLKLQRPSAETFTAFLIRVSGNGFGTRPDILLTDIFGGLTLIGWLICCGVMIRLLADRETIRPLLPWFVLGLYGLGNAVLITFGRSHMGLEQAFAPRYTGFTMFLGLSVAILPVIASFKRPDLAGLRTVAWGMSLWMLAATALKWAKHRDDFERMRHFTTGIALGKAGLLVGRHIPYSEQESLVFFPASRYEFYKGWLKILSENAEWLDSNRMIRPSLIREPYLSLSRQNPTAVKGSFSGVSSLRDSLFAKGLIEDPLLLPLRQAVIVTVLDSAGRRRFLGIDNSGRVEWKAAFPRSRLNSGDGLLEAWLLDGEEGTFRSIQGNHATPD